MTGTTDDHLPQDLLNSTVELLADLAAISSPSGDPGGLWRMAERLAAELRRRGLAAEVRAGLVEEDEAAPASDAGSGTGGGHPLDGDRPDGEPPLPVLTARRGNAGPHAGRHLLLIGHFDTVLPAAPPRREDGRLVATGAIDMKGGLAALLGALDLLALRGVQPPDDLLLVAVPDEEVAGTLSRAALRRWGPQARGLWVLEPGEPGNEPGAETVVGGRRGMFGWRLEVQGQAAHSGLHYARGRSALLAAARWCLGAPEAAASAAVDSAAVASGDGAPADGAGMGSGRVGTGAPTVNSGRLVAGDATFVDDLADSHRWLGTDRQLNVVPDRAVVEGEARFLRTSEGEDLGQRLEALAASIAVATGTRLSLQRGAIIPPVEPHAAQLAYCRRAVDLAARRGWRLEIEQERGGLSFPNFLPPGLPRIPTLDGLGPIGGGMHTRDEWIDLRSLGRRVVLLADLLEDDQRRG